MSNKRLLKNSRLVFASLLLMGVLIAFGNVARAQASSSRSEDVATANVEPAKDTKAAAEEDEQAQFKHSWLVKWVAGATGLSVDQSYWLCVLFNFAVIAGVIGYLSKKNLPGLFKTRTISIQKAMQEARQASEEANRRLGEIENRLARLDTEIAAMRTNAEKEAVAEEARIKAAAEEDARKIVESAEQEIAAAVKAARRELTTYAANLAVSLASKQIKVDTATDQALVRGFSRDLSPKTKTGQDGN